MFLRGSALTKRLKLASALLAAFVATLLSVAVASPAQATGISGCPYPKVCFYLTQADWNSGHSTAQFQDVTSSFQTLGSRSHGSFGAYSTRNDDRTIFHFTNGQTYCLAPNSGVLFNSWVVDGIMIQDAANC